MPPPIDTNVIIREITQDDPEMSARAHKFLQRLAAGATEALLTEAVLVECAQVLSSRALYNLPRREIARDLGVIIRLRGVRLVNKRRYLRALEVYAAIPALDFVDALLVIYAESQRPTAVVSFDEDFDRVPGVTRMAP
ncbi:MAG TPA: PIN domain-containing protein [Dehalococcoidia bacterium]|nr:PIN domain-containing protein [Dehalococcoidia bacterium]